MPLISLVIVLIIVGVLLWLLQVFGLLGSMEQIPNYPFGKGVRT